MKQKVFTAAVLAVGGIGSITYQNILKQLAKKGISYDQFWQYKATTIWQVCKLNKLQQKNLVAFKKKFTPESYYGWIEAQQIKLIYHADKDYPKLLKEIEGKPLILYAKGDLKHCLHRPIAVVGTRKMTGYGRLVCKKIVTELLAYDVSIISGFMYGVDTYAHQLAVANQAPTVGVLGFGFSHMYPKENQHFFNEMLFKGNAFVTEYPPWQGGNKNSFRVRNRIVAGMSHATVVIEAGEKSGTLITANYAVDFGRGVCVVAGPITSPYSEGTKYLANQGARLVSNAAEIIQEAAINLREDENINLIEKGVVNEANFDDKLQFKIYQQLVNQPLMIDDLVSQLNISVQMVSVTLSKMELNNLVFNEGNLWYPLKES